MSNFDIADTYPQGFWKVGDQKFINKYQALLHATKTGLNVRYEFFDQVWNNFNRSLIGKIPLNELYRQRAQQLRDSYDYLILYFSGGADSWNVLRSFLDNGIQLDEICVKWAKDTIDKGIYKPNDQNTTAFNYLSEWDLAIAPALEWVSTYYPHVKIEIVDWFENRSSIGSEEAFSVVNHWHDVEVPSLAVWSPNELKLTEKGKKVAGIYGVDKPQVYFENEQAYMFFNDKAVTMGTPCPYNVRGTEYFYWSPKFPLLAFEMASVAAKAFTVNENLKDYAFKNLKGNAQLYFDLIQVQQKELRPVLYTNWTNRFQTLKPVKPDRSDKHWWIYKYPELVKFKDSYRDMVNLHVAQLRQDLYFTSGGSSMYKFCNTKKHLIASCQS